MKIMSIFNNMIFALVACAVLTIGVDAKRVRLNLRGKAGRVNANIKASAPLNGAAFTSGQDLKAPGLPAVIDDEADPGIAVNRLLSNKVNKAAASACSLGDQ